MIPSRRFNAPLPSIPWIGRLFLNLSQVQAPRSQLSPRLATRAVQAISFSWIANQSSFLFFVSLPFFRGNGW